MDFEDSGIDSDPKATSPKEPIITFSPEKARFEKSNSNNSSTTASSSNNNGRSHVKKSSATTTSSSSEKRKNKRLPGAGGSIEDEVEIRSSASDRRGLIPPSRLAIPSKSQPACNKDTDNSTTTFEHKPLVQWGDSDESEDELSFFPGNKAKRGILTDNLSIDNLSLEDGDEEEDLHLTPPARAPLRTRCPDLLSAPCNRYGSGYWRPPGSGYKEPDLDFRHANSGTQTWIGEVANSNLQRTVTQFPTRAAAPLASGGLGVFVG